MDYKYVPINRIFSKLIRDYTSSFNEGDVIEWCGEALEFIGAAKHYEEAVAFIEVKNSRFSLPKGLHAVIQIARNNGYFPKAKDCPKQIIDEIKDVKCNECGDYIVLDCNGQPMMDYDVAYYRPYFDLIGEYYGWSNSRRYKQAFTPVRLATSTLFNSIVCKETDMSPYIGATDTYTIVQGDTVWTSFQEGQVAVAYLRQLRDKNTGYPLIPDNISYTTAITRYIMMMIEGRKEYGSKTHSKLEADWQWYCKQASNVDMMPYGVDEHQNLLDQRSYILPRDNSYFSFFGNLAAPENRRAVMGHGNNYHAE